MVFDADVRYSGVSIGYTLSQVVGSAFPPTIAAALYSATKSSDAIVGYLVAVSVISAISVCLMPGPWRGYSTRSEADVTWPAKREHPPHGRGDASGEGRCSARSR